VKKVLKVIKVLQESMVLKAHQESMVLKVLKVLKDT
jgi:hypothetical protein